MNQVDPAVSIKKYLEDVKIFLAQYDGGEEKLFERPEHEDGGEYGLTLMASNLAHLKRPSAEAAFVHAAVEDLIKRIHEKIQSLVDGAGGSEKAREKIKYYEEALYKEKSFKGVYQALHAGEDL